jgi:hypothetical protein
MGVFSLIGLVSTLAVSALGSGGFFLYRIFTHSFQNNPEVEGQKYAELHDPTLPRNPSMDIYNRNNAIDVDLTYKELHSYYKVMRCLVKNKEFLPDERQPTKDLTKRELLLASLNPENNDRVIHLKKTKAKAVHIREVLNLVNMIGTENEEELKLALEQEYMQYSIGKHR